VLQVVRLTASYCLVFPDPGVQQQGEEGPRAKERKEVLSCWEQRLQRWAQQLQ